MKEIGDRLKAIRNELGITQQEFADGLGIQRGTVANYEIGKNKPIAAIIKMICEKYSINKKWLETGEGDMFADLSRDEEIARFVAKATSGRGENIQRRLLALLSSMTDEEMEVMVRVMDRFSSTKEDKKEETGQ